MIVRSDYGVLRLRTGMSHLHNPASKPRSLKDEIADAYRMRGSTILLLSLRSLAHETIKNLVLAGIGRLIIMDDGKVTEEDLAGGFLFREEDGAVGMLVSYTSDPQERGESLRKRRSL